MVIRIFIITCSLILAFTLPAYAQDKSSAPPSLPKQAVLAGDRKIAPPPLPQSPPAYPAVDSGHSPQPKDISPSVSIAAGSSVLPDVFQGKADFLQVSKALADSLKTAVSVYPDSPLAVRLSNSDINRIICTDGVIKKDPGFSTEKGVEVKVDGNNVYVKFKLMRVASTKKTVYSSTPTELFITCGDNVYTIIAVPERIPSQTVKLAGGTKSNAKKNLSLFAGMPLEKKVLALIKSVFAGEIPDSFTVKHVMKPISIFKDVKITHTKTVVMDGEDLGLREYLLLINPGSSLDKVEFDERYFLNTSLVKKANPLEEENEPIVAISLDKTALEGKSDFARLIICEKTINK